MRPRVSRATRKVMIRRTLTLFPLIAAMALRKRFMNLLVLVETAVITATIANALGMAMDIRSRFNAPTGVEESNIGVIRSIGVIGASNTSTAARNLQILRDVPFVRSVAYGAPPLLNTSTVLVGKRPDLSGQSIEVNLFRGSQGLTSTLNLEVVAGRSFQIDDLSDASSFNDDTQLPALLTTALADRLFPAGDGLGKLIYTDANSMRVIGVVRQLRTQLTGMPMDEYAIINEIRVNEENLGGAYTIRAQQGKLEESLAKAALAMQLANPGHVQAEVFTLARRRLERFEAEKAVARMLFTVVSLLLSVLIGGTAGLTHFSVQQRTRQIGILRALGATRTDIVLSFVCENFVLVGVGVLVGAALALGVNVHMAYQYGLPRLALTVPFGCGLALSVMSLITVAAVSRRISRVEPASLVG